MNFCSDKESVWHEFKTTETLKVYLNGIVFRKNGLFACRVQEQYTFQVLLVWVFVKLLSLKNISTAHVKVYFSPAPFACVEKTVGVWG